MILLELVIVFIDVDAELYFLDGDDLLIFFGRALLLLFFIEKLAVILNAADWRVGGSGNLYQVKATFTGDFERFKRLHDAKLATVLINNADFAGANALISADKTLVDTFLRQACACRIGIAARSIARVQVLTRGSNWQLAIDTIRNRHNSQ